MSFSLRYWIERWEDKSRGDFRSLGKYGIERAKQILKHYNLHGVLIGSVAKAVWEGTLERISKENSKDTDVLVLDSSGRKFPKVNEGGIDWFTCHKNDWLPSNQQMFLDYKIELKETSRYAPGLYLLHWSVIKKVDQFLLEDRDGFPMPASIVKPLKISDLEQLPNHPLHIIDPADLELTFSLGGPKGNPGRFFPNFIQAGLCRCDGEF